MFKRLSVTTVLYFALVFFVASSRSAHAYLDPGSGSFALQFLLAGGLGALFFVRSYLSKIKNFFFSVFTKKKTDTAPTKGKNGK